MTATKHSAIDAFRESMAANGLRCPDNIVADGKIYRFNVNGDKPGSKNGWYVFFGDGLPAGAYGSWKTGKTFKWCAKEERTLTDAERTKWRERIARAKEVKDQEQERLRSEAQKKGLFRIFAEQDYLPDGFSGRANRGHDTHKLYVTKIDILYKSTQETCTMDSVIESLT